MDFGTLGLDQVTIGKVVALVLGNVPMVGLLLALAIPVCIHRPPTSERLLSYVLWLGLGVPMVWAAYWHLLRPNEAAKLIGWAPSPFQREVGLADLAMGVVACVAATRPRPFRGAIVWTLAISLVGDAIGHVIEMIRTRDFAPDNVGSILWWDVFAPLIALILLVASGKRRNRLGTTSH